MIANFLDFKVGFSEFSTLLFPQAQLVSNLQVQETWENLTFQLLFQFLSLLLSPAPWVNFKLKKMEEVLVQKM